MSKELQKLNQKKDLIFYSILKCLVALGFRKMNVFYLIFFYF